MDAKNRPIAMMQVLAFPDGEVSYSLWVHPQGVGNGYAIDAMYAVLDDVAGAPDTEEGGGGEDAQPPGAVKPPPVVTNPDDLIDWVPLDDEVPQ
jgi:hypothetical protein